MKLNIKIDQTGFPLVLIEPLSTYINWLPITKIQMEYFICSTSIPDYNEQWYSDVREYNDRISPGVVTVNNYWGTVMTGILPQEARQFASWLGTNFDLLRQDEWQEAYQFLKREPASSDHIDQILAMDKLNKRAATLIKNIAISLNEVTSISRGGLSLADQMLMRLGVMEYVYLDERRSTYGGFGQTNSVFFGSLVTPDKGYPERLTNPQEGTRMRHYGFRLIQRGTR